MILPSRNKIARTRMSKTVTLIGLGVMSSALVFPLAENGCRVRIVGTPYDKETILECQRTGNSPKISRPFPKGLSFYQFEQWKEVVKGSDFILAGISSYGAEWFLEEVLSKMEESIPVLSVVKGLKVYEDGSLTTWPEEWERRLAEKGLSRDIYMLGGPGVAADIISGDHTVTTLAGKDSDTLRMMKQCLETPLLHVSLTHDVVGLEYAVAIKNAYALGPAIAIGLGQRKDSPRPTGVNTQAAVFFQAAREMRRILRSVKAESDCISMGLADLFVTVEGGRTRAFGILLGEGYSKDEAKEKLKGMTLESISAVKSLYEGINILSRKEGSGVLMEEFPLIEHLYRVLFEGKDADLPWEKFSFEMI